VTEDALPRTGATYNLPSNENYPAIEDDTIDPDAHNATLEDLATALTASVSRDGAGAMSGNLAMGGNKVTGSAAATTAGDLIRYEQAQLVSAVATAWEGLAWAADKIGYATGATSFSLADITAGGRAALGVAGVNTYFLQYTGASAATAFNLFGTANTWSATQTAGRWAIDSTGYFDLNAGSPALAFDANDFWLYNRATNTLSWGVGGVTPFSILPTGEVIVYDAGPTSTATVGYRGTIINTQDGDYTLVLADSGKTVRHTNGSGHAHTIPPVGSVAWPIGSMVRFRNVGAGAVTITRGASVALRIAGVSTDANVTLAQWGDAVATMEASNTWVISGTGIS
jgi:hypothetical protein